MCIIFYLNQNKSNKLKIFKSLSFLCLRLHSTTAASERGVRRSEPTAPSRLMDRSPTSVNHHSADGAPQESSRPTISKKSIPPGTWLSCLVSHVDDPTNFCCQLLLPGDDGLDTLMKRLKDFVSKLPPGLGYTNTVNLGQMVIAKYAEDGEWYRATITGMLLYCVLLLSTCDTYPNMYL